MAFEDIIDIPSAEERFMGNYAIFSKFLYQFPERSLFGDLLDALDGGDVKKAFETAHTMKGIVGNLSLKGVEKPLLPIVEALRAGEMPDKAQTAELCEAYKTAVDAINEIKQTNASLF